MGRLLEHRLDGDRRWWARGLTTLGLVLILRVLVGVVRDGLS